MTVLVYVAKFTELAHLIDDYVAINMAKVRKFEDDLKLSIRGKIVGLLLQDLDLMVRIAMAIEREVDVHGTTGMWVLLKIRGRRVNLLLLARGRTRRLYSARISGTGPWLPRPRLSRIISMWQIFQGLQLAGAGDMFSLPST